MNPVIPYIAYIVTYVMAILNLIGLIVGTRFIASSPVIQRALDLGLLVGLLAIFVLRSYVAEYFALTNMFESVMAVNFALVLSRLLLDPTIKVRVFHVSAMALVVMGFVFSGALPQSIAPLPPALMSYWRAIHVPVILWSYALMFLASIGGGLLLMNPKSPDRDAIQGVTDKAVTLAVPLLAIGTALGAVWANEAWGTYWNWDPKENMALASLFVYGAYLHLRLNTDVPAEKLAWLLIIGFAVLMLTYIGINLLGVGLHSYGNFMMN
ncbi:MAG: cytochrome c biogenesis protein CcsA [Vampirovibrio sp.]